MRGRLFPSEDLARFNYTEQDLFSVWLISDGGTDAVPNPTDTPGWRQADQSFISGCTLASGRR